MPAVVQPGFYQSGTKRTRVVIVHMFMTRCWVEMNQCFIKKVKDAPVAVFIARSLYPNAHAAKIVARRHAFAATFVKTFPSNANAGLHGFFRILFAEQFCIMKCNANSMCALVQTPDICLG